MRNAAAKKVNNNHSQRGVVLILTLVLLVVLSIVGYTLTSRVSAQRHRCQYIIDYQSAQYACDAGTKYALATLHVIKPKFADRVNEPDFSDIFALSEEEYEQFIDEWAQLENPTSNQDLQSQKPPALQSQDFGSILSALGDTNSPGFIDQNDSTNFTSPANYNEPNEVKIPGPYGPPWPLVTKPRKFNIGSAMVDIRIEDENAKYPAGWALMINEKIQWELDAGFKTFTEWMNINEQEFSELRSDLDQITQLKVFKLKFQPIRRAKKVTRERVITRGNKKIKVPRTITVKQTLSVLVHIQDFAKLLHSSLIDTDILLRPTIDSKKRKESALKYMGLWGSDKVNINTAPRQVLEAAFTFGGNAALIADAVIRQRKIKPFKDLNELSARLLEYSESIKKCNQYITTESNFFTIKVTAISGAAEASKVIAMKKGKKGFEKVAVISL